MKLTQDMKLTYEISQFMRTSMFFVVTWLLVIIAVFPVFWALSSSLRNNKEIISNNPTLLPKNYTLANYTYIMTKRNFPRQFYSSTVIAVASAASVIFFASLGAYSLTRFKFKGRNVASQVILLTYLFPAVLLLVPMFIVIRNLGLANTYWSLVVVHTVTGLPLGLWLLRAYFLTIPIEFDQAAMIDGASRRQALVDIILPQAIPGIISTAIFIFIFSWNDYLWALVFLTSEAKKTLPLGISSYMNEFGFEWGPLMAATVAIAVPVVVLFIVVQSRLVRGLGSGAGGIKV